MTHNNTQDIHSLCTEQADAFAAADDLLPESFQGDYKRILTACYIAHALDVNPAAVMFGKHLKTQPGSTYTPKKPAVQLDDARTDVDTDIWPMKNHGDSSSRDSAWWTDSAGTIYDKSKHGWNKAEKKPSVKADGTFRNARSASKKKAAPKQKPAPAEKPQPETPSDDSEQALVEANQVLASFKSHVADATTDERLEQIGAQIELMGFTPSELTIAKRWIEERALSIEK